MNHKLFAREAVHEVERAVAPERDGERSAPLGLALIWAASPLSCALAAVSGAPTWAAVLTALPCAFIALACPLWARRSAAAFDRALVKMLAAGDCRNAPERIHRALGLRFFGPREIWWERVGRALAAAGEDRRARRAFARALAIYKDEDAAPLSLRLGYAHACYAIEDDVEACWAYERILTREPAMPRAAVNLAHALMRRNVSSSRVEEAIVRAYRSAPSPEERAVLETLAALLAVRRGRRRVRSLGSVRGPASERLEALKRELWRALGSKRPAQEHQAKVIALR